MAQSRWRSFPPALARLTMPSKPFVLCGQQSALVPRPLVLLELAGLLRASNPKEAASIYQQIKKEFPDTAIADQADRGWILFRRILISSAFRKLRGSAGI